MKTNVTLKLDAGGAYAAMRICTLTVCTAEKAPSPSQRRRPIVRLFCAASTGNSSALAAISASRWSPDGEGGLAWPGLPCRGQSSAPSPKFDGSTIDAWHAS